MIFIAGLILPDAALSMPVPSTNTLAPGSRLSPFFEKHGLDFRNITTFSYVIRSIKELIDDDIIRESHIVKLNHLFPDGNITIDEEIKDGRLISGGTYRYGVINFKEEKKTVKVCFVKDHEKLSDEDLRSLGIVTEEDKGYFFSSDLKGVWFVEMDRTDIPATSPSIWNKIKTAILKLYRRSDRSGNEKREEQLEGLKRGYEKLTLCYGGKFVTDNKNEDALKMMKDYMKQRLDYIKEDLQRGDLKDRYEEALVKIPTLLDVNSVAFQFFGSGMYLRDPGSGQKDWGYIDDIDIYAFLPDEWFEPGGILEEWAKSTDLENCVFTGDHWSQDDTLYVAEKYICNGLYSFNYDRKKHFNVTLLTKNNLLYGDDHEKARWYPHYPLYGADNETLRTLRSNVMDRYMAKYYQLYLNVVIHLLLGIEKEREGEQRDQITIEDLNDKAVNWEDLNSEPKEESAKLIKRLIQLAQMRDDEDSEKELYSLLMSIEGDGSFANDNIKDLKKEILQRLKKAKPLFSMPVLPENTDHLQEKELVENKENLKDQDGKTAEDKAEEIHKENLAQTPGIPKKTIICHIIADSILPAGQKDLLKELEQFVRGRDDYREKVVSLSVDDPEDFMKELAETKADIEKFYGDKGYKVRFDVACPDKGLVSQIQGLDIKALAFTKEGEGDILQVEGIILALRVLQTGNIDKLLSVYRFLTGKDPDIDTNDINELARNLLFVLPVEKMDIDSIAEINAIIEENIRSAA